MGRVQGNAYTRKMHQLYGKAFVVRDEWHMGIWEGGIRLVVFVFFLRD